MHYPVPDPERADELLAIRNQLMAEAPGGG
jgi:hypothetical protein